MKMAVIQSGKFAAIVSVYLANESRDGDAVNVKLVCNMKPTHKTGPNASMLAATQPRPNLVKAIIRILFMTAHRPPVRINRETLMVGNPR